MRRKPLRLARVARPLIALSLAAGTGAVFAQAEPWYIGVRQAFAYNDNLFKATEGNEESDKYSSTILLGGVNQEFGRQRFYIDGSLNWDRYEDYKQLDNDGWNISTGLDWQTVGFLSGTLRYNTRQQLADYGGPDAPGLTVKNIQNTEVYGGTASYAITRRFSLNVMAEHREVEFTAPEYADREYTQNVYSGGVRYGLQELMTFGLGYRVTKGDTPRAVIVAPGTYESDSSDRTDIDLTMSWRPSALSLLNARLSHSTEDHTHPNFADVDGITGALSWDYRPTAKLRFDLGLMHDTGSEILATSITTPGGGSTVQAYDTNRITDAARIGVFYELTSKIRMNAGFNGTKTTSEGGSVGVSDDETRTSRYTLGVTYAATDRISFGCSYDYEKQSESGGSSAVYKSSLSTCYGQFTLK